MSSKRIAVIPILERKGKRKLFLITSRTSRHWIIPTGKYEDLLSAKQVAVLEAFEECGVGGVIDNKFCKNLSVRLTRKGPKRKIKLFRMYVDQVHSKWPEKSERERVLVPITQLTQWIGNKQFAKQVIHFASD